YCVPQCPDVSIAGARSDSDVMLCDRLVSELADPLLAAALDVAADRAAGRLDLARGQATVGGGLQAVLAEGHGVGAPAQALVTALVLLAVLGSLGLQHRRYLASRAGREGRSRSPRSPRGLLASSCFSCPTWAKSKISPL